MPNEQFVLAISWWEQVTFWWDEDDDDVSVVKMF